MVAHLPCMQKAPSSKEVHSTVGSINCSSEWRKVHMWGALQPLKEKYISKEKPAIHIRQ